MKSHISYFKSRIGEFKQSVLIAKDHKGILNQIIDIIYHKALINTSPVDYYRYEFYKGDKSIEEKSYYIGKRGSRYYPFENNSIKYLILFKDKLIFKSLLNSFGLPQPALITTIGNRYELNTEELFISHIKAIEGDIVIKPIEGTGGKDILILSKDKSIFYSRGKRLNLKDIWNHVRRARANSGYLIEEKITQREDIAAIYPFSLNTFRVIAIKTNNENWHIAGIFLKAGRGGNEVDNIGAGGISNWINKQGEISYSYDGYLKKEIMFHPDTGKKLLGFKIKDYNQIIELALSASKKFGFMGTIGWDIALSDRGPMVIEGNSYYDCSYFQTGNQGPLISEEIAKGLKKRNMFTRWDKSKIYPHFNKKVKML